MGDQEPTRELATFVAEWRPPALPARARAEAIRALIDIIGVALVGTREPASAISAAFARAEGGAGPAAVIGHGFRTSASLAAFANGTAAHALDFDPSATVATTGHPIVCLAPAALAAADQVDASGADLLDAIVVGYEVVSRIGRSGGGDTGEFYRRGFHGTSVFGIFGATAAAARLYGLDAAQTRCAFGIAASGPKGVRANYGTMTKPFHAGEANRAGIAAALLARAGFDANSSALEARFGWLDAVVAGPGGGWPDTAGLGEHLAIEDGLSVKRFPSGGAGHGALRAVLALRAAHDLTAEDVASVEIEISRETVEKTLVIEWPNTGLEGKFCLPFCVAAALADGRITVATFEDANVGRLAPLRGRIHVVPVDGSPPVLARMRTADGREFEHAEPTGKSTPDDPAGGLLEMSDADLRGKFHDNATTVRPAAEAERLLSLIETIADATSVRSLTDASA